MTEGGRLSTVLALWLTVVVAAVTFSTATAGLTVRPGLVYGTVSPWGDPEATTVTARQQGQVVGQAHLSGDGRYVIPDLPIGAVELSADAYGIVLGRTVVTIKPEDASLWQPPTANVFGPFHVHRSVWRTTPQGVDRTDPEVAREVYALVLDQLSREHEGRDIVLAKETAHHGVVDFVWLAQSGIRLSDSLKGRIRRPTSPRIVWHNLRNLPSGITMVPVKDLMKHRYGNRYRVLELTQVILSDERTEAVVWSSDFCLDACGNGMVFWLTRRDGLSPWVIRSAVMTWVS
jgi:hypothetical protein